MEDFDNFRDTLTSNEKKALDDIYDKMTVEIKERLREEIKRDNEHIELVNLCYNLFTKTTEINRVTGYKVILVDPLCTAGVKSFDLMLYNETSHIVILVEMKSSISERGMGSVIDETVASAESARSNAEKLESIVGNKIKKMEFAVLSFAYYIETLKQLVVAKGASVCLWAYHVVPGLIQMARISENVTLEKQAGRIHEDENMHNTLSKGISTRMGALRSLPIMPTSHMFAKLEYIAQQLFVLLDRKPQDTRRFGYLEVYNLCKQAFSATELDDSQLEEETKKVIASAVEAGLFRKINDGDDLSIAEFDLSYGRREYRKFLEDYLEKRAKDKAFIVAIEEFKQKKGLRKLNEY
jgi:hypothetical protein